MEGFDIPKPLIIIAACLLLGSWFVLGEKSFAEKLALVLAVVILYAAVRLLGGAGLAEIFSPLLMIGR